MHELGWIHALNTSPGKPSPHPTGAAPGACGWHKTWAWTQTNAVSSLAEQCKAWSRGWKTKLQSMLQGPSRSILGLEGASRGKSAMPTLSLSSMYPASFWKPPVTGKGSVQSELGKKAMFGDHWKGPGAREGWTLPYLVSLSPSSLLPAACCWPQDGVAGRAPLGVSYRLNQRGPFWAAAASGSPSVTKLPEKSDL